MMRRTPLVAKTPLKRRTPLRAVSLKRQAAQAGASKAKRAKDTGPARSTRELVLERDSYECFCCGAQVYSQPYSLQHRVARGMGGTSDPLINSPANLITLLGTATSDHCHHRVEQRGEADHVAGYWLRAGQVPADTPVLHWRLGPVLLGHDGSVTPIGRAA